MLTPSLTSSLNLNLPKASKAKLEDNTKFNSTLAAQAAAQTEQPQLTQQAINNLDANTGKSTSSYTALISKTAKFQPPTNEESLLRPDELRYGRKRPDLPLTFGFGIKRFTTVPLAMRFSLIEGAKPETPQEAVAAQLNLAATNTQPYDKGKQLNIYT